MVKKSGKRPGTEFKDTRRAGPTHRPRIKLRGDQEEKLRDLEFQISERRLKNKLNRAKMSGIHDLRKHRRFQMKSDSK